MTKLPLLLSRFFPLILLLLQLYTQFPILLRKLGFTFDEAQSNNQFQGAGELATQAGDDVAEDVTDDRAKQGQNSDNNDSY
jgi:hypothetical protein